MYKNVHSLKNNTWITIDRVLVLSPDVMLLENIFNSIGHVVSLILLLNLPFDNLYEVVGDSPDSANQNKPEENRKSLEEHGERLQVTAHSIVKKGAQKDVENDVEY
jgi:hypothetical protein